MNGISDILKPKRVKNNVIYILLVFAPIAVAFEFLHFSHLVLFFTSVVALVPLAKLIGDSTEHLSSHYGASVGSLLNVTFGNAAEIIIAIVAINAGLLDLVKATITGAILGNILLVFGLSVLLGGFKYKEQFFSRESVGVQSSMLFLAVIALAVPTIMASTVLQPESTENVQKVQTLSDALAIILLVVYVAGIIFTLVTHKQVFAQNKSSEGNGEAEQDAQEEEQSSENNDSKWSKKKSFILLGLSMLGVVAVSEILVGSVELTAEQFGFGELFVGVVIVGIIGNAAEHSTAIFLARKGKIDISIGIAAGSGTQIALFVVPILVLAALLMGKSFTLVFTSMEVITIFLAAIILNMIALDGKSNWFEGAMLTAVYVIVALGFFFIS